MADASSSPPSAGSPPAKSERRSLLTTLLLLACCTPGPHAAAQAQETPVNLRLDVVAWGDDIPGLWLNRGSARQTITARSFRYSEPIPYNGPALLEIHRSDAPAPAATTVKSQDDLDHELKPLLPEPANGETQTSIDPELERRRKDQPTLVALARLPASGCRRATLLLAPAANGTFLCHVINDDPSLLTPGRLRVLNLSPHPIAFRHSAGESKQLQPRQSHIFPRKEETLIYELAYQLEDEWIVQENNILSISPTEQVQMILLRSQNQTFLSSDGSSGGFLQIVTLRR
jgi:hypothetical protein